MKKVLLRAPVLSKSGYGEHARQVFQYLLTKNIDIQIQPLNWGITPWYLNEKDLDGLVGKIIQRCTFNPETKYDISLQVQLPNEWDPSLAKYNIGITAGVETTFVHPVWSTVHVDKMDKVIVPSKFTKLGFEKLAGKNEKIHVVPEAFFSELVESHHDLHLFDEILTTPFNFLTVGVLTGNTPETDRKNLFYLVKWFVEEFRNNKDVGLIIKTNRGRDTEIDKVGTKAILDRLLREVGHNQKGPSVYLLHGEMSRSDMAALYHNKKVKALVSATRGEGFGLPLLEAAVAGLPVLATNWSAHTEFMNLGQWVNFDYSLKNIPKEKIDNNIFIEQMEWAEVKEEDFKKKIRRFYKKDEMPMKWAETLQEKLKNRYSIESIINDYDEVLGNILK